jgi:hypothetical protein
MNNNGNINAYFNAKWNIEICKSGENGVYSHFPLGEDLKNNMILDQWLNGLTYLLSPSGGAIRQHSDGLSFSAITRGTMHVGAGQNEPAYNQTGLFIPIKSTNYIRPFFNQCTGIYYPESGMALFSRKYDFGIETGIVTYAEAGFRPDIANALPTGKINQLWSRFVFTAETGVSGYIYANSGENITGMDLSGVFVQSSRYDIPKHTSSIYSGFSGIPSFNLGWRYVWPESSGMFLINESGNTTGFVYSPTNITELVTGFISGYLSGGFFYPFTLSNYPSESSGLSGIYLQDEIVQTIYYPSGGNFSGFDNFTGKYFNLQSGYVHTGFNIGYQTYGSGFRPTNGTLTGSMTGIIGSRNILKLDGYITGTVGYRNIVYPITLTTGEFLKLRYDTYMRIPAIVDPIPITGNNIVYGEFNGSGQLKLIGQMKEIFGSLDGDGKVTQGNGAWWPIHKTNWRDLPSWQRDDTPYPNSHLSALMLASGIVIGGIGFNTGFPPINSGIPILTTWLDDEIRAESDLDPLIGTCSGGFPPGPRNYYEPKWFSSAGLTSFTSWPLYSKNNLLVHNYTAQNNPTGIWPNNIDIQMIFAGQYPNRDTGINGFLICKQSDGLITESRSYTDVQGRTFGNWQHVKPTIYENTGAFIDCRLQRNYSAWYYKFDNTQIKYEDQIINLYLNFSINRS